VSEIIPPLPLYALWHGLRQPYFFKVNQQIHKIIGNFKTYLEPLHMFRQIDCHLRRVCIRELQVLSASKYTICDFTVRVFTRVTIQDVWLDKIIN
jgi:hypothetical protein